MNHYTEAEIKEAHRLWYVGKYVHRRTDERVQPFLDLPTSTGWLKKSREALLLSVRGVASQLGISFQAYSRLERAEESGAITLRKLRACAEAMDCELVYALRPKTKIPFSQVIWRTLLAKATEQKGSYSHRRSAVLGARIARYMFDPAFRREQGWGNNTQQEARDIVQFLRQMRPASNHYNSTNVQGPKSRNPA